VPREQAHSELLKEFKDQVDFHAKANPPQQGPPTLGVQDNMPALATSNTAPQSPMAQAPVTQGNNSVMPPQSPASGITANAAPQAATPAPQPQTPPTAQPTPQSVNQPIGISSVGMGSDGQGSIQGITPEDAANMLNPQSASTQPTMSQPPVQDKMPSESFAKPPPAPERKPIILTRGEQQDKLKAISQVEALKAKPDALEFKQQKEDAANQIKVLQSMAKENRLSKKDQQDYLKHTEGLSLQAQIAYTDQFMKRINAEEKNKTANDRNSIARDRLKNAKDAKMPPELKAANDNYQKAAGRMTAYMQKDKVDLNPVEIARLTKERENLRQTHNALARKINLTSEIQWPTVDVGDTMPDDYRNPTPPDGVTDNGE
jgi:hypothetical protein